MWREPDELPAVQRAHTGAFGDKLSALTDAARTMQAVMDSIDAAGLNDAEAVALTQKVEQLGRAVDAARVTTATVISGRAHRGLGTDSLAWRLGASHENELLTLLTRASVPEMKRRVALGEKVAPRVWAGMVLEPVFPIVAAALAAGELGVDAAENIVRGLADYKVHGRFDANPADVDAAERDLVMSATGSLFDRRPTNEATRPGTQATGPVVRLGDSDGFTFTADRINEMTKPWQARLNPNGVAPNEAIVEAKSTFTFGRLRDDGLYPIRGGVTPDLKGRMDRLFDTYLSARSAPAFPSAEEQERIEAGELVPGAVLDERTGGEKRADILRGILTQVAQDPRTPTMGGMPPVVMVHVNATDLLADLGVGWIDGVDAPLSMKTINQMIDNGGMQPIFFGGNGAVLGLGTKARCFSPLQRKAITARDGGCILSGCTCPPQWCEVHHVVPWQNGGATDVSNGVLLCWYHHHTITSGTGWKIRMVDGMPLVKAPHWIDPAGRWRRPNKHRAHDTAPDGPRNTG
ncbi:HNH endonuclease signature motif containing protein [Cryobacterium sp. PAMC25264]|uniref:HNH endonuclease signature motif containing protein n=1 Tax=Cryobacterium sp. PAMC25264 TaxID=2861288 RepID=UPI001C6310C1|nr:HNH endonuclease signature motif containing protein [Cryobacterium sp. PAMC25264]QYF72786.1 HNH endonuclease [Cryobacterium sp. PAMC25264]